MGAFVLNQRDGIAKRYTRNGEYWVEGTELNDTIVNGGYYDSYEYYSLQADHYHRGDKATISGYEGSDKILNYGDKVYIHGGTGNDSIRNHFGKYLTICGSEGDDTVICQGEGLELIEYEPGDGHDVIYNFFDEEGLGTPENADYECIYITTGDKVDNSYFEGSDFVLKIGNGSITLKDAKGKKFDIQDSADNGGRSPFTKIKVLKDSSNTDPNPDDPLPPDDNVIYGTPEDDTIETNRDNVRVEALTGNDNITTRHDNVTINGGDDKDNIQSYGKRTSIIGGLGDDFLEIWSEASDATIKAGDGNDDILLSGGINAYADGEAGDDSFFIWLGSKDATVYGGNGNDGFEIGDENLLAYGGNDNDTFYATSGKNSTLYGDAGNDYILLRDTKTKFFGGSGDDTIRINSEAVDSTVNGGADSDTFIVNLSTYNGQSRTGKSAIIQDYEPGKDILILENAETVSHSIDGTDVILKLKSESISDYQLTLKNAVGKEITLTDSNGNTTKQTYKLANPENPPDGGNDNPPDDESYWTSEDLQTFLEAINYVAPVSMTKLSAWTDISSKLIPILTSAIDIATKKNTSEELKYKFIKMVGALTSITGDIKALKGKDSTLWALAGSGIGGIASWIKAFDVAKIDITEEEREKLQKDINKAVEDTADIVSDVSGTIIQKMLENNYSATELNSLNLKLKFGARATIALVMVGYYGANQYRESIQKYSAETLPLAMTAEATFVDVIVSALHGGAHYVSLGLDDLAFKGLRWAYFKVTGQKPVNSDKDYMEWIGEFIKRAIFDSSSADDTLEMDHNGEPPLYAQEGNDYIRNAFSNVKIYGGDGNDTIFSHEGAHGNYLNGNNGRDYIIANDTGSTVIGASGNDMLMSTGKRNSISGGDDTDFILLENASENTVNGGTGSDIISIENSKKTAIYYVEDDGNDIIFGYDEDDTIHIAGKTKYIVTENGQHIQIKVGNNVITLFEAAGKNINIENRDTADNPIDGINPFKPNPLIATTLNDITRNNLRASEISTISESKSLDLSGSKYSQVVSLEGGNQNIRFNDEDGNVAIVGENATGTKNVLLGDGNALGIFYSSKADINATVGSGRDSILVDNNARVRLDMTNADNTTITPYSGKVILDGYNADSRSSILLPEVDNLASAIKNNSIQLVGNEVRTDSASVKFNDQNNDSTIVNLVTKRGKTQKVGFTAWSGGTLDASELDDDLLLKGNYAEKSSDNQKRKGSSLIAGAGDDTILAGARDTVDGGDGENQIYLTPYQLRQTKHGATVIMSGNSRNTIHEFHNGFEYDSDRIGVDNLSETKFAFETDGLLISSTNSRTYLDSVGLAKVSSDTTNNLSSDEPEKVLLKDGTSTLKAALAQTNQSISVNKNNGGVADAFFGKNSGLNFSSLDKNISIDLSQGTGTIHNFYQYFSEPKPQPKNITLQGFNKLQGSNRNSTLIGSDNRNTLIAGNGNTSIWSGAGNDEMVGTGGSSDKKGSTTFVFRSGDEHDTISDFEFLTQENLYENTADKIDVDSLNDITNVFCANDDVFLKLNDATDYLTIKEARGKVFQINDLKAKVDTNISYDGLANCYFAETGSSLTVDSSVGSAEIWLDNSHGTLFLGSPIRTLDVSAVEGNTSLVGNEFNNTILAGHGNSSLWGGSSASNDLLIGGDSHNTFFYCAGNGKDTLRGTNDSDNIILSDISLDQITEAIITASGVAVTFNDGGSLNVEGHSDVTYQLADGSKYSANHERLEWENR